MLKEEAEKVLISKSYKISKQEDDADFKLYITQEKNRNTVYLSLNGTPLYKRNYKASFFAKAPIKEHLAAALMNLIDFPKNFSKKDVIYVPFAGSGTLGFEAILNFYNLRPLIWRQDYSMKNMVAYPTASQSYLEKTAKKELEHFNGQYVNVDFVEFDKKTADELLKNVEKFKLVNESFNFSINHNDFFKESFERFDSKNVVVCLNPPYGLRLDTGGSKFDFYKAIAEKLLEISSVATSVSGFCLLPDEKSAFTFTDTLGLDKCKISHLTQGGQHIRVASFSI